MEDIIIAPIITEKSMRDAALGKFTFKVAKDSNKNAIKREVEKKFKVNVLQTHVIVVKGKRKRTGIRRIEVTINPWKKAIVQLAKDQKIALFDVGGQEKK